MTGILESEFNFFKLIYRVKGVYKIFLFHFLWWWCCCCCVVVVRGGRGGCDEVKEYITGSEKRGATLGDFQKFLVYL